MDNSIICDLCTSIYIYVNHIYIYIYTYNHIYIHKLSIKLHETIIEVNGLSWGCKPLQAFCDSPTWVPP